MRFGDTFAVKACVVGTALVDVIFGRHHLMFFYYRKASLVAFGDVQFDVFDHQLLVLDKLSKGAIRSHKWFLDS